MSPFAPRKQRSFLVAFAERGGTRLSAIASARRSHHLPSPFGRGAGGEGQNGLPSPVYGRGAGAHALQHLRLRSPLSRVGQAVPDTLPLRPCAGRPSPARINHSAHCNPQTHPLAAYSGFTERHRFAQQNLEDHSHGPDAFQCDVKSLRSRIARATGRRNAASALTTCPRSSEIEVIRDLRRKPRH